MKLLLRRSSKNSFTRRLATAASFAALLFASSFAERASAKTYFGANNGLWTTTTNWSPFGEPQMNEDVILGTHSAGTTDLHVIYDRVYNYNADPFTYTLNSVALNSTALNGFMIVDQNVAGSTLAAQSVTIGSTVNANIWNLSNGNFYTNNLTLGQGPNSRNNSFNVSGNGNAAMSQTTIGAAGSGTLNQTGGTVTLNGDLTIGSLAGGSGTYNLSGGLLQPGNNNPYLHVGAYGTGLFSVSSSGQANLHVLYVNSYGGASATCNVTGGSVNASEILVGNAGVGGSGPNPSGTMNVSGGKVSGTLTLWDGGTFNLKTGGVYASGGDGSIEFFINGGGLFSLQGGTIQNALYAIQMTGNGEFRLNGNSATLGGLTGVGIVRSNAAGNVTLTLNVPLSRDYDFTGAISDGTSGVVSLTITGTNPSNLGNSHGSQTLSGTNIYTGPTTVTDYGTLKAGSNSAIPVHTVLTLSNSGTFDTSGFTTTTDALYANGGTLKVDGAGVFNTGSANAPMSFAGKFVGNGTINKLGAGQWSLDAGASTFNGTINLQNGFLVSAAANSLPPLATINVTGPAVLTAADDQTIGALAGNAGALVSLQNNGTFSVGNNNTDSVYLGKFTSDGAVQKIGTGTFTLGSGAADTASTLSGTGAANFTVAGGTLALNKADGTVAVGGALTVNGGILTLARGNQIADTSALAVNGGTFKLNGFKETVGNLSGTGGTIDLGGGTLLVTENTASTFAGALVGGGTFTKGGAPTLTLTNAANYGGVFITNNSALNLQGAVNATGGTANNGSALNFVTGTANLNNGSITSNPGGFVQYFGATINNAFLRGSGAQVIVANGYPASTFNNVTTYNSAVLTQNGGATFNNFTNGGTINNNAPATYTGGLNTITGTVNVKSTLATTDFGTSGLLNISSGGALSNTGSNLVAGGGSRTTINAGGTLSTAAGTSIELNGALLVNNGTQTGVLNVNYGSTAKGSGTFGTVNVTDGGRFGVNATSAVASSFKALSLPNIELAARGGLAATAFVGPMLASTPAAANASSLTLGSGSVFAFNLQNAAGAAGTGYDLVHSTGALTLAAGTTVGNRITVSVFSLAADGTSGPAANFDTTHSYQFVLVQADGGVTSFVSGQFVVDTAGFQNSLNGGNFSVLQQGNNLVLAYNAVPEPGTWAAVGLGSVALGFVVLRRRVRR